MDPTEQTLKLHHPSGGARDTVWLSFKPGHSGHDLLPATTPRKVHKSRSTSVYCLRRLHLAIRHRWKDRTVAAAEEIWMPLKVHNHDRKSGMMINVSNGGEVSDIFAIINGVQAGVRTGSPMILSISIARRSF